MHPHQVFHHQVTMTKVPVRWEKVRYIAGLDVAQQNDWMALAVLELVYAPAVSKVPSEIRLVSWIGGRCFIQTPWLNLASSSLTSSLPGRSCWQQMPLGQVSHFMRIW